MARRIPAQHLARRPADPNSTLLSRTLLPFSLAAGSPAIYIQVTVFDLRSGGDPRVKNVEGDLTKVARGPLLHARNLVREARAAAAPLRAGRDKAGPFFQSAASHGAFDDRYEKMGPFRPDAAVSPSLSLALSPVHSTRCMTCARCLQADQVAAAVKGHELIFHCATAAPTAANAANKKLMARLPLPCLPRLLLTFPLRARSMAPPPP